MRKRAALAAGLFLLLAAVLVLPASSSGQKAGPPPEGHPVVPEIISSMGGMMERIMESWLGLLSRPDTAEKLAAFTKNYYEALRTKGFSKDEAMRLATSTSFPTMGR